MATQTAVQPDNRPVTVFPDQRAFIVAVFHELNRRLEPAQLADDSTNGSLLFAQVTERNPETVGQLADWLEAAVKRILWDDRLVWKVPPRALTGPNPTKAENQREAQEAFTKLRQKAEARAKYAAEQEVAEKRIRGRINAYSPTKLGRLDYSAQAKFQEHWRAELETAKKNGSDLCKLEKEMSK